MSGIDRLIRNVTELGVPQTVGVAIDHTKKDFIRLQRLQMLTGRTSTGARIGKYKSKDYAISKYVQNPLAGLGNVDLRLHGDFQGGIFLEVRGHSFVEDSLDPKAPKLTAQYGPTIWGLAPNNQKEYVGNYLTPEGIRLFKKQILR